MWDVYFDHTRIISPYCPSLPLLKMTRHWFSSDVWYLEYVDGSFVMNACLSLLTNEQFMGNLICSICSIYYFLYYFIIVTFFMHGLQKKIIYNNLFFYRCVKKKKTEVNWVIRICMTQVNEFPLSLFANTFILEII